MDRIKARILVQAAIRIAAVHGFDAAVLARGDEDAGTLTIEIDRGQTSLVLIQVRDGEGRLSWRASGDGPMDPPTLAAYRERARKRDPDLWVIGIDDPRGTFDPAILNGLLT